LPNTVIFPHIYVTQGNVATQLK